MHCSWLPVLSLFLIHFASMFPEVFVALDVQLHEVADFDRVDFPGAAVTNLMHCFPEDVFVFVLVDVFALIVRFDGQLHFLHGALLGMQLLQVLIRVFTLKVPVCVSKAPSEAPRHDEGRGLCTPTTHGGVKERGGSFGAVEDELGWTRTRVEG